MNIWIYGVGALLIGSLSYGALFSDGHQFVNRDGSLSKQPNGQIYSSSTVKRALQAAGWNPASAEFREFTNLGLRSDAGANTRRLELIGMLQPGAGGRPAAVSDPMIGSRPGMVVPPSQDRRQTRQSQSSIGTQTDMRSIDEEETLDEERRFGIHRQRQLARTRWNMGIRMVRQAIRKDLQSKNYKADINQMKSVIQKLKGEAMHLHQVKQILEGSNLRLHQIGTELLSDNESAHKLIVLMEQGLEEAQSQIALLNSQIQELEKTIKSELPQKS